MYFLKELFKIPLITKFEMQIIKLIFMKGLTHKILQLQKICICTLLT